ncbi:MAG: YegS/Rv2252/BmrU family lipid kinase [Tissierellia bacterium]|nr:YegS/Rv2252/BmrU family lipid kinase [Tissierellia bacterium]
MQHLLFLYNPKSGKGLIKDHLSDAINYYSNKGYLTDVYATQSAGDGRKKVMEIGENYEKIIVSGGDGTLDEIVSGSIKAGIDPIIGYIPMGSTNDFSVSIDIPEDVNKAIELSVKDNPVEIDVGKFENKYFIYVAAFGSIAEVSYDTDQNMKNAFGRFAYILEGFKSLKNLKTYKMRVDLDGEIIEGDYMLGAITNSVSVGGFKGLMGKDVELSDGLFEVTLVKKPRTIIELNKIMAELGNENIKTKLIVSRKARKIKIESDDKIKWTLDGEYGGNYKLCQIEVINKAIKLNTGLR